MVTVHWLYYTTLTNLALSSIERPELSFDFGCWTRGGVIFGMYSAIGYNVQEKRLLIGYLFCQLALPLSKTTLWLVNDRSLWRIGYTSKEFWRRPKAVWKGGVISLAKRTVERCGGNELTATANIWTKRKKKHKLIIKVIVEFYTLPLVLLFGNYHAHVHVCLGVNNKRNHP